jgi:hypothetical protein
MKDTRRTDYTSYGAAVAAGLTKRRYEGHTDEETYVHCLGSNLVDDMVSKEVKLT